MRRLGWGHACFAVFVVTVLWAGGIMLSAFRADAADHTATPPDCAWVGTQQKGADLCRDKGWVITTWLAVNPHGVVSARNYLPPCTYEDASGGPLPCGWNMRGMHTGNGRGFAYWVGRDYHFHYVWGHRPVPIREGYAHWAGPWERHHLDLTKKCWVFKNKQHHWTHQCPGDQDPNI